MTLIEYLVKSLDAEGTGSNRQIVYVCLKPSVSKLGKEVVEKKVGYLVTEYYRSRGYEVKSVLSNPPQIIIEKEGVLAHFVGYHLSRRVKNGRVVE